MLPVQFFIIYGMPESSFTRQEIETLRKETPGCSKVIHFNNAGASLMPEVVGRRTIEYLEEEMAYGGYETAEKYQDRINSVYNHLASYLNCLPSEIAITENATVAWGQAFGSIPLGNGDCILTSVSEYASNFIPYLQIAKRKGVMVKVIPNDKFGQVDVSALEEMIDDRVKLIAVTHIPTNGGLVNPAVEIGKVARAHNIWYLLDACQSAGQLSLDINEIGCDFLSATGRKYVRGPRGVGFLFASRQRTAGLEPTMLDLHGATWTTQDSYQPRNDAGKYETWESNRSGVIGLAAAVEYMLNIGVDRIWQRIQYLADYLRAALEPLSFAEVYDLGLQKCGIVSIATERTPADVKRSMLESGINVSIIHPAHTLIDMTSRNLGNMIRASVHYYNTEEEIDRFIQQLQTIHN